MAEEEEDLAIEVVDLVEEAEDLIEAIITVAMAIEEPLHQMVAVFLVNVPELKGYIIDINTSGDKFDKTCKKI